MSKNNDFVVLFSDRPVRRVWSGKKEKWYFSVVDIIAILTDSSDARNYWKVFKSRLREEGSQLATKCNQLKLLSKDGKKYLTDVAGVETILRLVQSVPSPKAEPFKLWLAKVGYERMQETVDPERAISRARSNWEALGHSKKWIEERMLSVQTRNKLTDYWADHGIDKKSEFAKLTNVIHKEWSGLSVREHKDLKGLAQQNLRDHMSDAELIFRALAELSTREIAESERAEGYPPNESAAYVGGKISGTARKEFENKTNKKVVADENYLNPAKEVKKISDSSFDE